MAELTAAKPKAKKKTKKTDDESVPGIRDSDLQLPDVPTHSLTSLTTDTPKDEIQTDQQSTSKADSTHAAQDEETTDTQNEQNSTHCEDDSTIDKSQFEIPKENVILIEEDEELTEKSPPIESKESWHSACENPEDSNADKEIIIATPSSIKTEENLTEIQRDKTVESSEPPESIEGEPEQVVNAEEETDVSETSDDIKVERTASGRFSRFEEVQVNPSSVPENVSDSQEDTLKAETKPLDIEEAVVDNVMQFEDSVSANPSTSRLEEGADTIVDSEKGEATDGIKQKEVEVTHEESTKNAEQKDMEEAEAIQAQAERLKIGEVAVTERVEEPKEIAASPNTSRPNANVKVVRDHLYPSLPTVDPNAPAAEEEELTPLTEQQIRTLYYNQQLEHNDKYIDSFLVTVHIDKHEFYEIVQCYYRARHRLASAEHDVSVLRRDAATYCDIVWQIKEESVDLQGHCLDKAKVTGVHTYKVSVYNEEACNDLQRTLKDVRNQIHEELALYAYEAQLSKLQVESYIHQVYAKHPALLDLPQNAPVSSWLPLQRDAEVTHQVAALKECISVLFAFQRKPATDDVFVKDSRKWLQNMVATLLRLATVEDHLYLLNQVLRCPGGVGTWATSFIQTLPPPVTDSDQQAWDCPLLDHLITMIATLLIPVKSRENLLYQMKVSLTPTPDKVVDNPWILVDSDGEEDEDPMNSWHYLHENDIVGLLNQLPLEYAFKHVLYVTQHNGNDVYSVHRTSEGGMLKVFAFATCVVRLLGKGLNHFQQSRYRQLNKRLGRLIRQVVHFTSDHWQNFEQSMGASLSSQSKKRLQLEYDQLFYRATSCLLNAQRLGSWQYLANMPFTCVSLDMMWRLMWLMHRGCQGNLPDSDENEISATECFNSLQDSDNQLWFEERLIAMPTSESIYLLTTFANMARSRPAEETNFMEAVAIEIFNIAYIGSHTREFCSRTGRELLFSIACQHPSAMSLLLHKCRQNIDKIGMPENGNADPEMQEFFKVSQFLFQGLPLSLWNPKSEDLTLLRVWLLEKALTSPESQLARLILDSCNWEWSEKNGELFLPLDLHQEMALLLVECATKHLTGKAVTGIFTDGISPPTSSPSHIPEHQLSTWLWHLSLRLKLHTMSLPAEAPPAALPHELPNLHTQPQWQPIGVAQTKGYSIATYLALVMSKYGHNIEDFCAEGVKWLQFLVEKGHYVPVVRVIAYITPLAINTDYLLINQTFLSILQFVLTVDSSRKSMVFFSDFPGPITALLTNAIEHQIRVAMTSSSVSGEQTILFWLSLLTKLQHWYTERNIQYVIDSILMSAFRTPSMMDKVYELFYKITKDFATNGPEQNLLTSVVQWLSSAPSRPSLIDSYSNPEFPWYAYVVLHCENLWEDDVTLWKKLQMEMFKDSAQPIDQALRKVCSELSLSHPHAPYRLCIYRWAQQAMDMGFMEPLLPLVWQRFFVLYLARLAPEAGLPSRGSIGEKFFDASPNISMLKKMKRRLQETVDHFHQLANVGRKEAGTEEAEGSSEEEGVEDRQETDRRKQMCITLAKSYQTLLFWLDEPRLHDPALYLPALPPQYQADRLLTLFQNDKTPWLDMFDAVRTDRMISAMATSWQNHVLPENKKEVDTTILTKESKLTPSQRIVERLGKMEVVVRPPPLVKLSAPVPDVSTAILTDKQNLLFSLRGDFTSLVDYAKIYSVREAKHVHLDCTYMELLPQLYTNETTESSQSIPCRSTFNPTHRCKGPAVLTCRYDAAKRNDIINRKVNENRAEFKQVMIEALLPPPQNVCSGAVHVENAVSSLIKLKNASDTSVGTKKTIANVGITLFYHVATFISENTKYYPPTRQFFSSVIEILGQEFIRNNPSQSQPLLQAVLQTPSLAGLLAPNFSPNATPDLFVAMYEDMIRVPANQGSEVAFTLLTKFDVSAWLLSARPALSARSALVAAISAALYQCDKEPRDELRMVFEVYRTHLQHVFLYNFPDHYGDVLKVMLKGSSVGSLSPLVWVDFLESLGASNKPATKPPPQMSLSHIKETMEWLSSHFFRVRVANADTASFGLYPKWKDYISSIASFFDYLTTGCMMATVKNMKSGASSSPEGVAGVINAVIDLFAPWIQPLDNNGQILSPWIEGDAASAMEIVEVWAKAFGSMQELFKDFLPLPELYPVDRVLFYYVNMIAKKGTPDHVLNVFHAKMMTLPWNLLLPGPETMDLIIKVVSNGSYSPCCKHFLGQSLFITLPWATVVSSWANTLPTNTASHCYGALFHALLCLAKESCVLQQPEFAALLRSAAVFEWNFVDAVSYNVAVEAFVNNCDAKCVLAERSSHPAAVLSLMKSACGIIPSPVQQYHPETPVKRATYIRNMVHLVCRCTHLKDVPTEGYQAVIANTIMDVENCVAHIVDASAQHEESLALCKELLNFLNNCNPSVTNVMTDAVLGWVTSSPSSILLYPFILAACRSIAGVGAMVSIVEACMEAHFMAERDFRREDGCGWSQLLTVLEVPDVSHAAFLQQAVSRGCYLTLYAYVLQRLPLSQSLDDEMIQLSNIRDWTLAARPVPPQEVKLLLLWEKVLELSLRQVDYGGKLDLVGQVLQQVSNALASLGEDKTTTGILGAIGLGKKSQLGLGFRIIAKSLAAYISAQVPKESYIRLHPGAVGHILQGKHHSPGGTNMSPSPQATQYFSHLESVRTQKQYAQYREHVDYSLEFLSNTAHTLREAPTLYAELVNRLYPDSHFLAVIKPKRM